MSMCLGWQTKCFDTLADIVPGLSISPSSSRRMIEESSCFFSR